LWFPKLQESLISTFGSQQRMESSRSLKILEETLSSEAQRSFYT